MKRRPDMSVDKNISAAKKFVEVGLNQKNIGAIMAGLCSPDLVLEAPGVPAAVGSSQGYQVFYDAVHGWTDAFPDVRVDIAHLVTEDTSASFDLVYEGTHAKEFLGVPATGERVRGGELWFVDFDDDGRFKSVRICEYGTSLLTSLREAAARRATEEQNKQLTRRYYAELMSSGDLTFVDRYFSEKFEFTNPTHSEPYRGQEFKELVKMLRGAFPDLAFSIEHLLAQGDTVVAHWTARGTHTGTPLRTLRGDIPARARPFVIDGMSWLRLEAGRFVEARINEDTLGLLTQIGGLPAPGTPVPPPLTTREENLRLIGRYFDELMNQGRLEVIDELIAERFSFHIPTLPEPIRGREGMRAFVTGLRIGLPDIRFTVERLAAEGNKAAARWYVEGTHAGPFLGIPPTNRKVKDQGVDIFVISEGKIAEIWVNENDLGLLSQLGALG
jgi:steroid delta-isomerase-like uncharacterized protein